jgi:hypothetical protein
LETEEQTLEREQDELDVLEALGEYKCDARIGSSIDSGIGSSIDNGIGYQL